MSNFVLETKLRELDLLIDEVIINVNNKYKSLKNNIVDTNYKLLYNLYYTNTLESNKRIYTQRKMLIDVKMLDLYFYKLTSTTRELEKNCNTIQKDVTSSQEEQQNLINWLKEMI